MALGLSAPASAQSTGLGSCEALSLAGSRLMATIYVDYDDSARPNPAGGYSIHVSRRQGNRIDDSGVFSLHGGTIMAMRWDTSSYYPTLEVRVDTLDAASQILRLEIDRDGPDFLVSTELMPSPASDGADWQVHDLARCTMLAPPVMVAPAN